MANTNAMDASFFLSRCEREFRDLEILLFCRDKLHADGLRRCAVEVAEWVKLNGRKLALVHWPEDKGTPYQIESWLATMQPEPQPEVRSQPAIEQIVGSVFSGQLHLPLKLLKRMVEAAEAERPISIVNQRTKQQICINRPMEVLLQTPAAEATQRIMTNFWRPSDLAELERRYRQESRFRWRYDAGLNETTWAILEAEFERFEGGDGDWYGFVTNYYNEPIPYPVDLRQPV